MEKYIALLFFLIMGSSNYYWIFRPENDPVNDVFSSYTIEVFTIDSVDGNQQPVPTSVSTSILSLMDIVPIQHGDAVVIECRVQGQSIVDGIIRIRSNSTVLLLTIRFHCQVN